MKVAFIGHRHAPETEALTAQIKEVVRALIEDEGADTFLFGSKSAFDTLCYEAVTELKEAFPHIRRVYMRTAYEEADDYTLKYLLKGYEETIFPAGVAGAGVLSYIKRNQAMVDACDLLVTFCEPKDPYKSRKSGTRIAVQYAQRKKKRIFNLFVE